MQEDIFGQLDKLDDKAGFLDFFKDIKDHRIERKKLHRLDEIIFLAFCGYIANCNSWEDLELFGIEKIGFLKQFLPYENGAASDDTLRRFFRVLDPKVFEQKFELWVQSIMSNKSSALNINDDSDSSKIIAIDGKTSRGSHDGNAKAIHVVSAFVAEDKITLASRTVDCKTNEIKVIPELLDAIDLTKAIVTVDAMGAQYEIANKIINKTGDYIFSLKGNQKTLENDVIDIFKNQNKVNKQYINVIEDHDKCHGRFETRHCTIITDPEWIKWLIQDRHKWHTIQSVIKITSTRTIKGVASIEDRYYISSLITTATLVQSSIRSHGMMENALNWTLDVTFGDDKSRIRKGNAPQNMLIIKKAALNLLQIIKSQFPRINRVRASIARLRKIACWTDSWLMQILEAKYASTVQ